MPAAYPDARRVLIRNAGIPGTFTGPGGDVSRFDLLIENDSIARLAEAGAISAEGAADYDLDGGLAFPAFADIHTHLDKGHIWPRRQNPDGTWLSALLAVQSDRETLWKADDVERRMEFSLRCAYAHGTAAIRTHLDSIPPQHGISWELFERVRERWASRIELQAVALVSPELLVDPTGLDEVARRTREAGGILGGAVHSFDRSKEAMRALVDKAGDLDLDIDVHVDECLNASSTALLDLAEAVIESGFRGKVAAGHCCALTVQDDPTRRRTIENVAEAGIAIISLPMCNLYLQDRDASGTSTPIRRGATLLKEFAAAGVPVAIGSDNTRDPFYAYGDLDALEVLREATRVLHLDHTREASWTWARTVTGGAAAIAGFAHRAQIAEGAPADLVLFRARSWTELFARPHNDRIVLRGGKGIDTTLPDYRELDDLMEA